MLKRFFNFLKRLVFANDGHESWTNLEMIKKTNLETKEELKKLFSGN